MIVYHKVQKGVQKNTESACVDRDHNSTLVLLNFTHEHNSCCVFSPHLTHFSLVLGDRQDVCSWTTENPSNDLHYV